MTSTAGSYDDGRSRLRSAIILLGHYAGRIVTILFAGIVVYAAVRVWTAVPAGRAVFGYGAPILALLLFVAQRVHRKNLCLRDFNGPLLSDPQGRIDKHDVRLRQYHGTLTQRLIMTAGAVFVAAQVTSATVTLPLWAKIPATLALLGAGAAIVYLDYVETVHTRLRQYCPYCRKRGDGDQAPAPAPDPVGNAAR